MPIASPNSSRTAEMTALREGGKTLQEIGDRYGISRERVRQLVGSTRKATHCKQCGNELTEGLNLGAIYCSDRCRDLGYRVRQLHPCPDCGRQCKGEVCKSCKRRRWEQDRDRKYERLEKLWSAGLSMKEIAAELGTTTNALGGLLVRARDAGRDLPLRKAASPKSKDLTKAEARFQFAAALRKGTIRRSARCEDCGEQTDVEGHHVDYQRPLFVFWLCSSCHLRAHDKQPIKEAARCFS